MGVRWRQEADTAHACPEYPGALSTPRISLVDLKRGVRVVTLAYMVCGTGGYGGGVVPGVVQTGWVRGGCYTGYPASPSPYPYIGIARAQPVTSRPRVHHGPLQGPSWTPPHTPWLLARLTAL